MQFLNDPLAALGLGDSAGADSGTLTPESIELRRKMALAMLDQSQKDPIKSNAQGLNSVLKSIVGAYQLNKLDKADRAGKKEADDLLDRMFGGGAAKPVATSEPVPGTSMTRDNSLGSLVGGPAPEIAPYANAIASIESADSKNPYQAIGPRTRNGDRALGKYQVMSANVPEWTEKHLGKRMTAAEFLRDPDAQEKVFAGEFGGYLQKYGNPEDAASMWFSGKPAAQGAGRNDGYTSQPEYLRRFTAALKLDGGQKTAAAASPVMSDAGASGAAPTPAGAVMAEPAQNTMAQRALALMKNPRTAPLGQALLQKALTTESKDPLIVKVPGEDGSEVQMIYDRAANSLKPLSSLIPGASTGAPQAAAPQAAAPAGAPSAQNIGEVGAGPAELAAMRPINVAGQVSNVAGKGDMGAAAPLAPTAAPQVAPAPTQMAPAAPAASDMPPGARPGPFWKGKVPEGFIQRQSPDGQFLVDARGQPLFELKSEAEARAKADVKSDTARIDDNYKLKDAIAGIDESFKATNDLINHPGTASIAGRPFGGEIGFRGTGVNLADITPGTTQADAFNKHKTLISKVVLGTMQQLKATSSQGATGFGALSEKELKVLENSSGNLNLSSSYPELIKNYKDFQKKLLDVRERMIERYKNRYGGGDIGVMSKQELINSAAERALDDRGQTIVRPRQLMGFDIPLTATVDTPAAAASKKQPQTVLEAMMTRLGR